MHTKGKVAESEKKKTDTSMSTWKIVKENSSDIHRSGKGVKGNQCQGYIQDRRVLSGGLETVLFGGGGFMGGSGVGGVFRETLVGNVGVGRDRVELNLVLFRVRGGLKKL